MAKRFLEGLKKAPDGRYILRESISVTPDQIRAVPLEEKEIKEIREKKADFNGKTKYIIKVWDRGFNANERSYSKVIDRVVRENKRTVGLMNHPEDEPDPRDIFAVEKNPFIDEDGWMSVEFCPCGQFGQTIEDVIQNDGPITVSSACLGNLDDEGYVINDETFELERYFDFVFGPSNRLNQYQNSTEKREDDGSISPVSTKGIFGDIVKETAIDVNTHRDNASMEEKYRKPLKEAGEHNMPEKENTLLETTMKMNIRSMVKEADKTESLSEKKEILTSAHSYASQIEDKKLMEEIGNEIAKVEADIQTLTEKGLKTDELDKSVKELTEQKTKLEADVKNLTEEKAKVENQLKTITTLYEQKQYKASETEVEKNRRLAKEVCSLKLKAKRQEEQIARLQRGKKIAERKAVMTEAEANTKADASMLLTLKEENKKLKSQNRKLTERLHEARSSSFRNPSARPTNSKSRFQSARERMEERRAQLRTVEQKPMNENKSPKENGAFLDEDERMELMLGGNK